MKLEIENRFFESTTKFSPTIFLKDFLLINKLPQKNKLKSVSLSKIQSAANKKQEKERNEY